MIKITDGIYRVIRTAIEDIYNNEMRLFTEYSLCGEHTDYEKLAFNNCGGNMQNLGAILTTLDENRVEEKWNRKAEI